MAILYVASEASELKPFADLLTGLRQLKWPVDYAFEGVLQSSQGPAALRQPADEFASSSGGTNDTRPVVQASSKSRRILLAANGAGPKLAAHVVEIAIRAGMVAELSSSPLEAVVSTGYSGALDPALREGSIVVASQVILPASDRKFDCLPVESNLPYSAGPLLSQDRVISNTSQKRELQQSGAIAVDMEAAGVAERTRKAGLPFCCIKVISDRADESLPFDLNRMRTPEGRIARGKIIGHAVAHPKLVPALFHLRRRARDAAQFLGEFLVSCRISTESESGRIAEAGS